MNERNHDDRREALSAYLLGALSPNEMAEMEGHLSTCEECRAELSWLQPAAQMLPESVDRVEPPPELRSRIMAEVRADASPGTATKKARRSRAGLRITGLRFAIGLAVLLVLMGMIGRFSISKNDSGGATTAATGKVPGVTAQVVRKDDEGTLRLANLQQLPSNKVLEVWVRRDNQVEPAGAFLVPSPDGTAATVIDMHGVDLVMVTAEPRGGSEFPTSKPLVQVSTPE